jgi:hypothetical protein
MWITGALPTGEKLLNKKLVGGLCSKTNLQLLDMLDISFWITQLLQAL